MYLVSACLAGLRTRYDGADCSDDKVRSLVSEGRAIPVCPEQLGGLPTPREPIELTGGDGNMLLKGFAKAVGQKSGKDYTQNLTKGADEVMKLARMMNPEKVILKDGSPSCGSCHIKLKGEKIEGTGVTAAALLNTGVKVEGH